MDASKTKFGFIFIDMVNTLLDCFPDCANTLRIHKQLQEDPEQLNTIKLDWARFVQPVDARTYKRGIDYLTTVKQKVASTHIFNQLQITEKYIAFGQAGDRDGQEMLSQTLIDLEDFALDDAEVDFNDEQSSSSSEKDAKFVSRFADPELHQMLINHEAFKSNPQIILDLQRIAINEPLLNRLFAKNTNEQICKRTVQMKPLLPKLVQWIQDGTIPISKMVAIMAKALPQEPNMRPTRTSVAPVKVDPISVD